MRYPPKWRARGLPLQDGTTAAHDNKQVHQAKRSPLFMSSSKPAGFVSKIVAGLAAAWQPRRNGRIAATVQAREPGSTVREPGSTGLPSLARGQALIQLRRNQWRRGRSASLAEQGHPAEVPV